MTLPNAIFVDTNIFERQHFNFDGPVLSSLAQACKAHGIPLLLPDPILRELIRHVRVRAKEAHELVSKGRRTAPFLDTLRPSTTPVEELTSYNATAETALKSYFARFSTVDLGYDGLDLNELMNWYDTQSPPFGSGGKRKEFPDAFAIAIVERFARERGIYVAVVSDDKGLKAACDRYTNLSHFMELSVLVELLLDDENLVTAYKKIIENDPTELESQVAAAAAELPFLHLDRDYSISWSKVLAARMLSIRVVALSHGECTVTFVADVDAEHTLEWREDDTPEGDIECSADVIEPSSIAGLAKVQIDLQGRRVTSVVMVEVDKSIRRVTETPSRYL